MAIEQIGTYHLADNPQLFEIQRNNNYEFIVTDIDDILRAGAIGTESNARIKNAQEMLRLSVNGAFITKGDILNQVINASTTVPDFIVFDGLMNDDSQTQYYTTKLGEISENFDDSALDTTTFYGAFEHLLYTLRTKYMNSNI